MRKLVFIVLAVIISLVPIISVGCGEAEVKTVTVGNKNFTEEYIIGQLMKQLLEEHGYMSLWCLTFRLWRLGRE